MDRQRKKHSSINININLKVSHKQQLKPKLTSRKKNKSKSLQNLKIKYYALTPESLSKSHSKGHSKSKSRGNSKSLSKSKKKIAGFKCSPTSSLHHSHKKSHSKSKSPLISKKRSLQVFKIKEDASQREKQKDKSKDKKYQKNNTTIKKSHPHPIPIEKAVKTMPNPSKKIIEQIHKNKPKKSKEKIKHPSPPKKTKTYSLTPFKPKSKKLKKPKPSKIYSQNFLDRMATKIQSVWRGYLVRKHFAHQLTQITQRIHNLKHQLTLKHSPLWQSHSNHSITHLESHSEQQPENQPPNKSPQFMLEIEKLRKKLDQQEGRFRLLSLENNQLRANLQKIGQQNASASKGKKTSQRQLLVDQKVVSMRIQSEESPDHQDQKKLHSEQKTKKIKVQILELPPAIKTEQSNQEPDYSFLKKKVQLFECSPKSSQLNFKFNQSIIKKLFTQQQQKLNEKYFKKSNQFKNMLQNQLVSPKTYHQKCSQLQFKFKTQKQGTLKKYKQAQKALLLIAQLQQQQHSFMEDDQNNNPNLKNSLNPSNPNSLNTSELQFPSPQKKTISLIINVDQIQSNFQKYHPVIVNHSHREHELESQDNLSELYQKAMSDKVSPKKRDAYTNPQHQPEDPSKQQSTDAPIPQLQYPQFHISPQKPQTKGFQTNLKYIRLFYIRFCQFFREIPSYRQQILSNITQQITFDEVLYLHSFRTFTQEESIQYLFPYFKSLATYNTAIPVYILNSYYSELTNPESPLYHRETQELKFSSKQEYQEMGYSSYELKQYYDLALIDAFNQAINFQRPGGPQASNLDALTQHPRAICKYRLSKKLSTTLKQSIKEENLNILLGNTIGRIINLWACSLCGFINDSIDQEQKIDESKVQQIRMHRLSLLLERTLLEEEHTLTNLYPFQLHAKLDLAADFALALIREATVQIYNISQYR